MFNLDYMKFEEKLDTLRGKHNKLNDFSFGPWEYGFRSVCDIVLYMITQNQAEIQQVEDYLINKRRELQTKLYATATVTYKATRAIKYQMDGANVAIHEILTLIMECNNV